MLFSRPVFALIETVMPTAPAGTDAATLEKAAQNLVVRKITGLSFPLRCVLMIVGVCFDFAAYLTIGKRFSDASRAKRQTHVERAQRWPLVPFREFVRLVRSFTLMAFYDHPATRGALGFRAGGMS